ncbi:serine hydrolase [Tessaracoccus sp. MC1865]|uniref:serine hydrolase domain-containing protein n=1 Tax=Tessaracoccus sp. MC1865 TaxID=2760310 RepID=UPI001AE5CD93|nr:serine hydrolase [Tessaracoccus sp. MC1865]QTO37168.1 serine hydrolase [Tessaracoccus sp. MC1865]
MATRVGRRRPRWVVVGVVLAIVVTMVLAGYLYVRPLLRTGTGYAAHSLCAVTEVAGRTDASEDLPPNPLVPFLTQFKNGGYAYVNVLGLFAGQTAYYTEGLGCTLSPRRPVFPTPEALPPTSLLTDEPSLDASLDEAIGRAFGDGLSDDEARALGTRAIVVVKDGVIVGERYADGFTANTPQLGWSMTKSVTNLLTGRAVMQGAVALDDANLRPEWTDERAEITVDQLLRMTSGLEWDEEYDLGTPITEMLFNSDDMAAYVAGQPAAHEPGTFQQYSSGSTTLVCSVLNDRLGAGPTMPREQLFAPLGLASAVLEPDAAGTPVCGSYLWATPRDWARIGQFVLDDGVVDDVRLLPEGWVEESTTVVPLTGADTGEYATEEAGYASSWWTNLRGDGTLAHPELPEDLFWAQGHDGQRMYVAPSLDLVVVRMGFTPESRDLGLAELIRAAADTS